MTKPKKILVAYDGSPHSKAALSWALLLGSNGNAELALIKVFEPKGPLPVAITAQRVEQYTEMEKEDRQMLEDVKSDCEESCNLKVHVDLLVGCVTSTLLDYADQKGVDLIIAGTRGHGVLDGMLVGSVTNSLVSLSKVPVLIVKELQAPAKLQKILVAYDGSESANAAMDLAVDIGKSTCAKLAVVKVNDTDEADRKMMEGVRSAAASKGMEINNELLSGVDIADTIIQYAWENDADMIVSGTVGHGLFKELLLGSVARKLISLSRIPVLVVK